MSSVVPLRRYVAGEPDPTPLPVGIPEITDFTSIEAGLNVLWGWSGSGQNGFELQRRIGPDPGGDWSTVSYTDATTTNLTDTGVVADTEYYYRVRAWSGSISHAGDWSEIAGPAYYTYLP